MAIAALLALNEGPVHFEGHAWWKFQRSFFATLYPSCVIASTRWPPPGMTRIARPVAFSFAGR